MTFSENWEISIIELENSIGKKWKVTKRLPSYSISETKVFRSKGDAKKQFELWLGEHHPSSPSEAP